MGLFKDLTYASSRKTKKQQIEDDLKPVSPIMDSLTYSPTEEKIKKEELTTDEEEILADKE